MQQIDLWQPNAQSNHPAVSITHMSVILGPLPSTDMRLPPSLLTSHGAISDVWYAEVDPWGPITLAPRVSRRRHPSHPRGTFSQAQVNFSNDTSELTVAASCQPCHQPAWYAQPRTASSTPTLFHHVVLAYELPPPVFQRFQFLRRPFQSPHPSHPTQRAQRLSTARKAFLAPATSAIATAIATPRHSRLA
jgi:hypothetical protein